MQDSVRFAGAPRVIGRIRGRYARQRSSPLRIRRSPADRTVPCRSHGPLQIEPPPGYSARSQTVVSAGSAGSCSSSEESTTEPTGSSTGVSPRFAITVTPPFRNATTSSG